MCVLVGACLVTQEVSFEAPDSWSRLYRVAPTQEHVRVPVVPNPDCNRNTQAMRFAANVVDRDIDQTLYWKLYLNGFMKEQGETPNEEGADSRAIVPLCLTYEELNAGPRCNRVTLFVSTRPYDNFVPGLMDVQSTSIDWFVLKGSDSPNVSVADCAPPEADAGMQQ
jgi:hypothetical protein